MATDIRLPQWGMGMIEGEITQWYKAEGDSVAEGEPLAEVEAAKVTADLVAPAAGTLIRILVHAGKIVPVNELLAVLIGKDEDSQQPPVDGAPEVAGGPAPPVPAATSSGSGRNVVPRARMLARDLGVDLSTVAGTGPGARITEDDVRKAADGASAAALAEARAMETTAMEMPGAIVPMVGIRRTIARRMHASLQSMAQLTLVTTADVTDLVTHRSGLARQPRPTYTDFIIKAVAVALREHPGLNSTLEGDQIRILSNVHIGMATATESGLVVSVIRNADAKSVGQIATESAAVAERVRAGTFAGEDVSGSTFTVSSLGGQGIDSFTPIINPPEVAILGLGRIVDRATRAADGVAWRKEITLSLTIDHQVVDGAPGAAFLATIVELLGNLEMLSR